MKQPNQRVRFQFGGFKNLVFEFHKVRIRRTRGSESWFLSQWTVNWCVCVCVCVCVCTQACTCVYVCVPLGFTDFPRWYERTCVASTSGFNCQADLSADILTIWRVSCLVLTPPFSPSPCLFTLILAVMEKLLRAKPRHPVKYWYWESKVL